MLLFQCIWDDFVRPKVLQSQGDRRAMQLSADREGRVHLRQDEFRHFHARHTYGIPGNLKRCFLASCEVTDSVILRFY